MDHLTVSIPESREVKLRIETVRWELNGGVSRKEACTCLPSKRRKEKLFVSSSQQNENFFLNRFGYTKVEKNLFLLLEDADKAIFLLGRARFARPFYASLRFAPFPIVDAIRLASLRRARYARPFDPPPQGRCDTPRFAREGSLCSPF